MKIAMKLSGLKPGVSIRPSGIPPRLSSPSRVGFWGGGIIFILKFYRNYLSMFKLQCCRFYPSCSEYAIEAVEKYGPFKGILKSVKRLLRCHPFSRGGYDPA